jgi:hypothetical protein
MGKHAQRQGILVGIANNRLIAVSGGDRDAALKEKLIARKLEAATRQEIQRAYLIILADSGYGTIKIRIERAGQSPESHFVVLETEKKTK